MSDIINKLHHLSNVFDRADTLISAIERDIKLEKQRKETGDFSLMRSKVLEMRKEVTSLIREMVREERED